MDIPGYSIHRTLGRGGMARVYLATRDQTGTLSAVKTLGKNPQEISGEGSSLPNNQANRFNREGRIVAAVQHKHVVRIFDVGTTQEAMYIAMEYLPGGDLGARLGEPVNADASLNLIARIASALAPAHSAGIVHRDVKPTNILFRADGTPVLSDFGIAKELDTSSQLTRSGQVLGSPFYMSPEQIYGRGIDGRADLYALGIILYELLTGHRPYKGPSAFRIMMMHLEGPLPELPENYKAIQPLLDRLLAKDVDDRFANALELVSALRALLGSNVNTILDSEPHIPMRSVFTPQTAASFRRSVFDDLGNDQLEIPAVSDCITDACHALARGDVNREESIAFITAMPCMAARFVDIVNSPLFSGKKNYSSPTQAIAEIEPRTTQIVLTTLAIADLHTTPTLSTLGETLRAQWRHAIRVAAMAYFAARRVSRVDPNTALVAGLLHDVGKIPVIVWADPIPGIANTPSLLSSISAALHADLGQRMLASWRFATPFVEVAKHHESQETKQQSSLVDVIMVSDHLAYRGSTLPKAQIDVSTLPATERLALSLPALDAIVKQSQPLERHLLQLIGNRTQTPPT